MPVTCYVSPDARLQRTPPATSPRERPSSDDGHQGRRDQRRSPDREEHPGAELRYLDEAAVRSAAQADPALFVRHDGLLVLDEVQRVPDLLLAIKHEVDVDPRPGRFLLTVPAAFANHLRLPASTVKRCLDLLELLYVVHRIPAWSTNLTTRAVATPKLMVVDSGSLVTSLA